MRDRPFLAMNEQLRPYSEIRAERLGLDIDARRREQTLQRIQEIEAQALDAREAGDRAAWKRLQCEAEALRVEMDEGCRGLPLRAAANPEVNS